MTAATIRKAIVAGAAALGVLLVSALEVFSEWISADAAAWISTAIAVLGALGVYLVSNETVIDNIGTGRNIENPPPPGSTVT